MSEHEFVALVAELQATEACQLPPGLGPAAHALALEMVRRRAPELAQALHSEAGDAERRGSRVRPFSAALVTPAAAARGPLRLRADETLLLRVTSLDPDLSQLLLSLGEDALPAEIGLQGATLRRGRVITDGGAHALAGRDSVTTLTQRRLLSPQEPALPFHLRFLTPTRFQSQGRNLPLPLPELVFGSLLERWNSVAPVALPTETRSWAQERLAIAGYRLHTRRVAAAGGRFVGFVGECAYETGRPDPYWLRVIDLLCAFAFYAGVGGKTSMGFGQAADLRRSRATGRSAQSNVQEGTAAGGAAASEATAGRSETPAAAVIEGEKAVSDSRQRLSSPQVSSCTLRSLPLL